jgi:hypothetical protein
VPPVAVRIEEYDACVVPSGRASVSMRSGVETEIENWRVAVCPAASASRTEKA